MENTRKKSFIKGAGILALALFTAKILGALFKIPLTAVLGAEGMGVYQLIFPVYSFLLSTSSGALPVAISLLVSEKLAKGEPDGARGVLHTAMSVLLMSGILMSVALILLAKPIGILQGNENTFLGYLAIAPAVFFVSGIAVLRGWFQGIGNMAPPALSQISESAVKLLAGLGLAAFLMRYGIAWAVFGAMAGVTLSEAVTFLIMYIIYRKKEPPFRLNFKIREVKRSYRDILKISIPITIGGVILPFTQIIDSVLVVNILSNSMTVEAATASYGLFSGYVATLINLPIALGLSLGIAVVPQLSKGKAERNIAEIKDKASTAVKLALIIGVPFAFIYAAIPESVLSLIYRRATEAQISEAALLLRIGSVSVIALSVTQIHTSILQGIGETYKPVKNMAIGAGAKIILDVTLLPVIGIYGSAVASLISFIITAVLNGATHRKLLGKNIKLFKNSGIILGAGVIMGALVLLIKFLTVGKAAVIITAVVGGIAYVVLLFVFRVFTRNEVLSLPFGNKIVKILKYR